MIDLKTVKNIRISEGSVTKITNSSGVVLWEVKDTGTTAQTPCYYVAKNVSDLPSTPKYDMAYITSENRWYVLNNKSQWEKYGVIEFVSSIDSNVTAYNGKLVYNTTDKHEYKYTNNAWTDQGEVKVTQDVPDGYKTYDYIEQPTVMYRDTGATISAFTGVNGCTYNLKYYMPSANYSSSFYGWIIGECDGISNPPIGLYKLDNGWGTNSRTIAYYHSKWGMSNSINSGNGDIPTDQIFNMEFTPSSLIAYDTDGNVITTFKTSTNAEAFNSSVPLIMWGKIGNNYIVSGKLYELSMKDANGNMVNDCVPATETSSGNKGLLDLVTKTFYKVNDNSAVNMGTEKKYNSYIYPVSYEQYDAPNLNYTECANEAAMKALSCPYEGMKVKLTDTGKKYKFTYNSTTSQYEWDEITSSLDIDLNNQWIASTKKLEGYNVYMSNSNHNVNNGYASMKFKFKGMSDFKIWINSYAESNYDYTIAWDMDVDYPTSNPSNGSTGVKANTSGRQYDPTNITAFTEVDYSNDGGEHFVVVTYRKDSSVNANDDRGYVAIKLTLISTTWVVSSTEFVKKDDKYYQRLNEVGTYEGGITALTGNYKEGNELTPTYIQSTDATDFMVVGSGKYYKNYIYVTPVNTEINTGDYIQGDYIGEATPSMKVTYVDNTEKAFYNLTSIDQNTDSNKDNAKSVEIYDGVTSIETSAFAYCSSLTSITIPDSVTSIGNNAFYGCSSLRNITIGSGVTSIGNYAFEDCSSLTGITIPNSVTYIGSNAFSGCRSLTGIVIPNSVTSIRESTFASCSKLYIVTIQNSTSKLAYSYNAFGQITYNAKLYVPSNLLSQYQSDSNWVNAFKGGIFAIGT